LTSSGSPVADAAADVGSNESVASARILVLVLDALHVAPVRTLTVRQRGGSSSNSTSVIRSKSSHRRA
jgi:hypothetical protein